MPEGPAGAPRLTNIGPVSRRTGREIKQSWDECPKHGKPNVICREIKMAAIAILENQGFFAKCGTLEEINSGNCFRVAKRVFKEVDGVRIYVVGDKDHVWIKYDGRHYDAEVPTGVDNYMDLPFFNRVSPETLYHHARMAAEAEGKEPPQDFEDTVKDITWKYEE